MSTERDSDLIILLAEVVILTDSRTVMFFVFFFTCGFVEGEVIRWPSLFESGLVILFFLEMLERCHMRLGFFICLCVLFDYMCSGVLSLCVCLYV